jgi:8-hydroxy-5-deazaflavin:NADPH oxidoreductase
MKIAFIGIGNVGAPLADNLQKLGHEVLVAARDPDSKSVVAALALNPQLQVSTPIEAIRSAEVVFLATVFGDAQAALSPLIPALAGKILVDCTNPVGANLNHGLDSKISAGETIQQLVPAAKVVKAFTIYGYKNFEDTSYPGYGNLKPVMLIAGNDDSAKTSVADLCRQLGWEPVDTGSIAMSLHLEHMALLWIKLAMKQGVNFVWAMLQR